MKDGIIANRIKHDAKQQISRVRYSVSLFSFHATAPASNTNRNNKFEDSRARIPFAAKVRYMCGVTVRETSAGLLIYPSGNL